MRKLLMASAFLLSGVSAGLADPPGQIPQGGPQPQQGQRNDDMRDRSMHDSDRERAFRDRDDGGQGRDRDGGIGMNASATTTIEITVVAGAFALKMKTATFIADIGAIDIKRSPAGIAGGWGLPVTGPVNAMMSIGAHDRTV